MKTTTILTRSHLPSTKLLQEFLQHVRDFDTANPGCHFEIAIEVEDVPTDKAVEWLKLNPVLDLQVVYKAAAKREKP
jgi:hypothetical protein